MVNAQVRGSRKWFHAIVSGLIGAGLMAVWSACGPTVSERPSLLISTVSADDLPSAPARLAEPAPIDVNEPPLIEPAPESTANHAAVRNVIEQQLPKASAEERDIWYNQLKSLPPGVVEDILRLRQEIRRPSSPLWLPFPGDPQLQPPPMIHAPPNLMVPLVDIGSVPTGQQTSATLQRMREVTLQNLLHAQTVGYCRLVPMTSPIKDLGSAEAYHVALRWDGVMLEIEGGHYDETHRPLDLAIEGRGWLEIATPAGSAYTRSAHVIVQTDGRLGVLAGGEFMPLVPEIRVPSSVVRVEISPAGNVQAWSADEDEPIEIASLVLAAPRAAELMVYGAHGWLMPRDPAEPVDRGRPGTRGFDNLCIGMLVRSNVDAAAEKARLAEIDRLMQLLTPPRAYGQDAMSANQELPSY